MVTNSDLKRMIGLWERGLIATPEKALAALRDLVEVRQRAAQWRKSSIIGRIAHWVASGSGDHPMKTPTFSDDQVKDMLFDSGHSPSEVSDMMSRLRGEASNAER